VQADRVQRPAALQHLQRRAAIAEEVLGVHLQKGDGGLPLQQFAVMGVAPAYASAQGISSS
jgi:hypothetical protein